MKLCSEEHEPFLPKGRRIQKAAEFELLHRPSPPFLFSGYPESGRVSGKTRLFYFWLALSEKSQGIFPGMPFFPCSLNRERPGKNERYALTPSEYRLSESIRCTPLPLRGTRRRTRPAKPHSRKLQGADSNRAQWAKQGGGSPLP